MLGGAFAGRVAASQLETLGLRELVTASLKDYETLALSLARDPPRLASLRQQLVEARATTPLFDADAMRQNVERALLAICGDR
jgi:predicted O-linked N-acetylglucosamine transferase (SPINDLY family)